MFNSLKSKREDKKPEVDAATGEVKIDKPSVWNINLPNLAKARRIQEATWPRVPVYNLRDHPEFDGLTFAICHASLSTGEFGPFVKMEVFEIDANDKPIRPLVIITGSEDILSRISAIVDTISPSDPVVTVFRAGGRAWFME